MAEALYRKYRPRIFEDVVGQEHIERTIKNAIAQDKVSHAYLFTGPRGTGKTTTARLLAKALLCENGPTSEPDGTCDDCEMIATGTHPDVYELDAASRTGVENVREEIIGRVQFAPTRGDYKVYIIDEVHMLSTAAFNALLKTLEEPPGHVVFILCTTDPQKVPDTIHSRCQRFDFRRISNEAIVSRLGAICMEEGVEFEGDALELIAQRAEGGMRNALTSLEQLIAFGEGQVTLQNAERMLGALDTSDLAEIVRALGARDVAKAFRWTADYVETGADLAQFTRDLAEHVRTMYVLTLSGGESDVAVDVPETVRRELAEELPLFGPDRLARMMGVLGDLSAELRVSTNPRLSFEIALTRMVRPDSDLTLEALAERIERLEQGAPIQAAPALAAAVQPEPAASHPAEAVPARATAVEQVRYAVEPAADAVSEAASVPASETAQVAEALDASVPQPEPVRATSAERETVRTATAAAEQQQDPASAATEAPVQRTAAQEQSSESESDPEREAATATATASTGAVAIPERIQQDLQNPASLQRLWQAVLSTLKQEKAAYGVLLLNTKAVYDAQKQHLTIEFPAESDFAFTAASKPEASEELARSIQKVCGAAIPFTLTKGGQGAAGTATASSAATVSTIASASSTSSVASTANAASASTATAAVQPSSTEPMHRSEPAQQRGSIQQPKQAAQPAIRSAARSEVAEGASSRSAEPRQPQTAADDPYYDEVPLDAYGDVSYAVVSTDEASAPAAREATASAAAAQQGAGPARAAEEASQSRAAANEPTASESQSASRLEPAVDALTMATPEEPSASDLDAALADAFGEGMVFTEVED